MELGLISTCTLGFEEVWYLNRANNEGVIEFRLCDQMFWHAGTSRYEPGAAAGKQKEAGMQQTWRDKKEFSITAHETK